MSASVTAEGPSCRKASPKHSDEKILNPSKRSKHHTLKIKIRLPGKSTYKANGFDQSGQELWTSILAWMKAQCSGNVCISYHDGGDTCEITEWSDIRTALHFGHHKFDIKVLETAPAATISSGLTSGRKAMILIINHPRHPTLCVCLKILF